MPSKQVLGKVTAFITRDTPQGRELLVFRHPNAGVQLPAGTIEPDELPETAVLREVNEETGLTAVEIVRCLDTINQPLASDEYVLLRPSIMQSAPARAAPHNGFTLNRGWRVRFKQTDGDYAQVVYEEFEMRDQRVVNSNVEGWIRADALTQQIERHLFRLCLTAPTPDSWEQPADLGHTFTLYWTALDGVVGLVPVQQVWLNHILEQLWQNR